MISTPARAAALPAAASGLFPMHADYRPASDGRGIETEGASGRHFNRPLYGAGNGMLVLAGDRPIARAAGGGHVLGTLMVALRRGGRCGGWAQLDPRASTVHRRERASLGRVAQRRARAMKLAACNLGRNERGASERREQ